MIVLLLQLTLHAHMKCEMQPGEQHRIRSNKDMCSKYEWHLERSSCSRLVNANSLPKAQPCLFYLLQNGSCMSRVYFIYQMSKLIWPTGQVQFRLSR